MRLYHRMTDEQAKRDSVARTRQGQINRLITIQTDTGPVGYLVDNLSDADLVDMGHSCPIWSSNHTVITRELIYRGIVKATTYHKKMGYV